MDKQQAIEQLKDLRESQREFIDDNDKDCAFRQDVEALDLAIKVLEGTALEVPVQEQNKITSSLSYEQVISNQLLYITIKNVLRECMKFMKI